MCVPLKLKTSATCSISCKPAQCLLALERFNRCLNVQYWAMSVS